MGAQRRGTDKRPAFYLPTPQIDRIHLLPARPANRTVLKKTISML
jgi:hypothetical protein